MILKHHVRYSLALTLLFSQPLFGKKNSYDGPITFKEVGDMVIASHGVVEETPEIEETDPKATVNLKEVAQLTDQQKRERIYRILESTEKPGNVSDADGLRYDAMRAMLKDLDIFIGTGKSTKENLLTIINRTETLFGEAALAKMMSAPLTDIKQLRNRQALIQELVTNEKLFNKLSDILENVKDKENEILSFWQEDDKITQKVLQRLFFAPGSPNNKSPLMLELYTRLGNLNTGFKITGPLVVFTGITYLLYKNEAMNRALSSNPVGPIQPVGVWQACKKATNWLVSWYNPVAYYNEYSHIGSEAHYQEHRQAIEAMPEETREVLRRFGIEVDPSRAAFERTVPGQRRTTGVFLSIQAGIAALGAYWHSLTVKAALGDAASLKDAANFLQTRLIGMADLLESVDSVDSLVSNPEYKETLKNHLTAAKILNDGHKNDEIEYLITLLMSSTFEGKASFFSQTGKVLAAYTLMEHHKDAFVPFIAAIGEIDACMSMAKLIKASQNDRVVYSFVEFKESEKPYLLIEDFWNQFVDKRHVVVNTVEFGAPNGYRCMTLTGSNTGGKSTLLKAILMDLLTAHVGGFVAGKKAVMTPFAYIGTLIHVGDDVAAGHSKFAAEVKRAKECMDCIANLLPGQFAFIASDELFTGTSAEECENAEIDFEERIAANKHILSIGSTHYYKLTKLEERFKGIFKNFKVEVKKDEFGNLVRPFKLEPGINSSHIANDLLNQGFRK